MCGLEVSLPDELHTGVSSPRFLLSGVVLLVSFARRIILEAGVGEVKLVVARLHGLR